MHEHPHGERTGRSSVRPVAAIEPRGLLHGHHGRRAGSTARATARLQEERLDVVRLDRRPRPAARPRRGPRPTPRIAPRPAASASPAGADEQSTSPRRDVSGACLELEGQTPGEEHVVRERASALAATAGGHLALDRWPSESRLILL